MKELQSRMRAKKVFFTQRRKDRKGAKAFVILLCVFAIFASLREKPHLVLVPIFTFNVRLRHGLAGHTILALDPFAEV